MLEITGLSKKYSSRVAANAVNLTVEKGEFFALLGPSGCGKTTLLRMIAGLEKPDAGRIVLGGKNITEDPAQVRPINTVFQSYALFPHLNVFENVAFGLRVKGIGKNKIGELVEEALCLTKMSAFAERRIENLSGGEQQRIALARAIVNKPQILLLDEPLSALDQHLRREMQEQLRDLQRQMQSMFIVVTHDQSEAFALADRMAVLLDGKVAQVGTAEELYFRPKSRQVASFLGQLNEVKGTFVRPESMWIRELHSSKVEFGTKCVRATIIRRKFTGGTFEFLCELGPGEYKSHVTVIQSVDSFRLVNSGDAIPQQGADVSINWKSTSEIGFDPEVSGR